MRNQENPEKPLQQRVSDILQFKDAAYLVEESEDDSTIALFQELRQAKEDLQRIQQRIARLRGMLANERHEKCGQINL